MWLLGIAPTVMLLVSLAYRVCVRFWPPDTKLRQTHAQSFEESKNAYGIKLLTKPITKWSEVEAESEPEIHAWLQEQSNEILPWDWSDEARRKDPKGYAKCWRRIWRERKSYCEEILVKYQKEIKRLDQEFQTVTMIHTHRTNQIARLRAFAATNTFPCQVSLEHLEKGRFWGWNTRVEVVECEDAAAIMASTNSICSKETATARDELRESLALADTVSSSRKLADKCGRLLEICDKCNHLIDEEPLQDELLKKSLVENLNGVK